MGHLTNIFIVSANNGVVTVQLTPYFLSFGEAPVIFEERGYETLAASWRAEGQKECEVGSHSDADKCPQAVVPRSPSMASLPFPGLGATEDP